MMLKINKSLNEPVDVRGIVAPFKVEGSMESVWKIALYVCSILDQPCKRKVW